MSPSDSNKTPAREFALKYLFHLFLAQNSEEFEKFASGEMYSDELEASLVEFKESYTTEDEEHPDNRIDDRALFFAHKLIRGVSDHMEKIESLILKETKKSKMANIEKVERSILLIGVEELLHFETPYQVVINELVNLAKKYGSAESGRYVNGVLDGIRAKAN